MDEGLVFKFFYFVMNSGNDAGPIYSSTLDLGARHRWLFGG